MHYILKWRWNEDAPTTFEFVGPFLNHDAASRWGQSDQERSDDNPCWQVVQLPERFYAYDENGADIMNKVYPIEVKLPY